MLHLGLRHHHGEFFAAVSRRQIDASDGVLEHPGDRFEHFISHGMAVGVVDLLEEVEIDDGQ